jgi:hypothetical protein
MVKKLFVFLVLVGILVSGCVKMSTPSESQKEVSLGEIETQEETLYVRQNEASEFLEEGQSYIYSNNFLYKTLIDSDE